MTTKRGLLIDVATCLGCGKCVEACRKQNGLPPGDIREQTLSTRSLTVVQKEGKHFVRKLCMHCEKPSCATVCPVGAIEKKECGAVVYDPARCMGCRYCMVACPFGVPTYEWDSPNPQMKKCVLCVDRIEQGLPTACAAACPTESTLFGDREQLIDVAAHRIRKHAQKYRPSIFGLMEAGGTSVLYLSPVSLATLGFPGALGDEAPTEIPWRILKFVPNVVLLGAVLLGGSYWLFRRREEVARSENPKRNAVTTETEGGTKHA